MDLNITEVQFQWWKKCRFKLRWTSPRFLKLYGSTSQHLPLSLVGCRICWKCYRSWKLLSKYISSNTTTKPISSSSAFYWNLQNSCFAFVIFFQFFFQENRWVAQGETNQLMEKTIRTQVRIAIQFLENASFETFWFFDHKLEKTLKFWTKE